MTYTVVLFVTRNSHITSEQFRDHYENTHIPLAYSLLSHCWPITFNRRYLARIVRKGFGGPANVDRPPLLLRGVLNEEFDFDCISDMVFEDEAHFLEFYRSVYSKEISAVLTKDEANFLEGGKTRVIVIGETWTTDRAGSTTHSVGYGLMSDPSSSSSEDSRSTPG
ncbi:hypothetical protein COCMIDRAFT_90898 [Bipolaris oryzae ATCC 44560]|uniref:EthD domain-containing protein n=1 Tax=Bipolaris oryzae ATCC 44560 TaxID=930090 RepID=W6ZBD6_COCMI|nr:uncharacterized protein COCMIDRAFT_90898 [Bipolaris oryzae ATCC 44560]EUC47128.1 hypothetical protein COCMIDRAFT_90898 [Bipolaris oryzae ATCC 44560]